MRHGWMAMTQHACNSYGPIGKSNHPREGANNTWWQHPDFCSNEKAAVQAQARNMLP
jgi:hypothetical protein